MQIQTKTMNNSENHKAEDLQVISVAKSYGNNFSVANSYGKISKLSKFKSGGSLSFAAERDLVGGPTNGDTLGEAVISAQNLHLISNFETLKKNARKSD